MHVVNALHFFLPLGYTVCETVHRFHQHSGRSVFVEKRCAKPTECTTESIGCQKYKKHHNKHLTVSNEKNGFLQKAQADLGFISCIWHHNILMALLTRP